MPGKARSAFILRKRLNILTIVQKPSQTSLPLNLIFTGQSLLLAIIFMLGRYMSYPRRYYSRKKTRKGSHEISQKYGMVPCGFNGMGY